MPTANAIKGAATERMVAKYLKFEAFAAAERRLKEGRADDQGDIDGVPHFTIQVKYVAQPRLQSWVEDTLKQRDHAGNPFCVLIVRRKNQPVEKWDAYFPPLVKELGDVDTPESEAWTWTRMDLRMAVPVMSTLVRAHAWGMHPGLLGQSSNTSVSNWTDGTPACASAPSTERGTPPSPTT